MQDEWAGEPGGTPLDGPFAQEAAALGTFRGAIVGRPQEGLTA